MKKFLQGFGYAARGIVETIRAERNMRVHLAVAVLVIAAGCFWELSRWEWLTVGLMIFMVFMAEMFNTAIERVVDLASPAYHVLAGQAKDIAAGAVLLTAVGSVLVGIVVFLPHILPWMRNFM